MTESEIIEAAREAGWTGVYVQWAEPTGKPDYSPMRVSLTVPVTMEQIHRFAAIIEAKTREKLKCWCRTCRPITMDDMRFVVCPECGNKRCPKANDHRHVCTNSNEPGQPGSAYENVANAIRGQG